MNFLDLYKAKKIYAEGKNVTEYLRSDFNETENTSEIIEIAYDLQAGSYIDSVNSNREKAQFYALELAYLLEDHLHSQCSILDVGTGELTTLALMLNEVKSPISEVLAFDISWSRLFKGKKFFKANINNKGIKITTFVADMKFIPLRSKCVDVVTSSHALEPNGKNLPILLSELFRVAKHKLVLFEPSYELNSDEGRRRMEKLGYIKNVEGAVSSLGGKVLDISLVNNTGNSLNPTACYVIEPPIHKEKRGSEKPVICVPGTDLPLVKKEGFLMSKDTGLAFPILDEIPILKNQYGILSTALFDG